MNRGWLVAVGVAMCAVAASPATQGQNPPVLAEPVVEFTKTRFATAEQVFFWEGVKAQAGYRIPENLWSTCRLTITRPDGTQRVDRVGWPRDGMPYGGWLGGAGLGTETPQVGQYAVVFEFAGQQTRPDTFTVDNVPILKDISAEFVFPSPLALASLDAVVTLTVRNGSDRTIRFPHRGMMFGHVSDWRIRRPILHDHPDARWRGRRAVGRLRAISHTRQLARVRESQSLRGRAMDIRGERPDDVAAIRAVNLAAFETSTEANLVDALRQKATPVISFVAEDEEGIVGHIMFSPVTLATAPGVSLMGLAPMAVVAARQRQGIGSRLVREGLERCRELDVAGVVVLGHPEFYPRFGFVPAARMQLRCEYDVPEQYFMVREMHESALRGFSGTLRYHPAFADI